MPEISIVHRTPVSEFTSGKGSPAHHPGLGGAEELCTSDSRSQRSVDSAKYIVTALYPARVTVLPNTPLLALLKVAITSIAIRALRMSSS
jgi:hypothetical protein